MNLRKLLTFATLCLFTQPAFCQDKAEKKDTAAKAEVLEIGKGKVVITKPAAWKTVAPGMMVDNEFRFPAEGDGSARITISQAGGGVEPNVTRWIGQFEGGTKENTKIEKKEVDKTIVRIVEIEGTFKESRGPNTPMKKQENYKMLSAILELKDGELIFVKATGPKDTIAKMREDFIKMIDGLKNK
jgi:hypothetical protein